MSVKGSLNAIGLLDISKKFLDCDDKLKQWDRREFGRLHCAIQKKENELIDLTMVSIYEINLDMISKCKVELNTFSVQEEMYWKQRSKSLWLAKGDKNSSYFHSITSAR